MNILLQNQKNSGSLAALVNRFGKMKNSGMIVLTALTLSISTSAFSQSSSQVNEPTSIESTAGTFQFESPTGKLFFWRMDFIESLYPEIESRRALDHTTIWHYSADMDIIIYATNEISASDFVPLDSPYNGAKEY